MAQEETDDRESYTTSILPISSTRQSPFHQLRSEMLLRIEVAGGSLWPTASQPNDDDPPLNIKCIKEHLSHIPFCISNYTVLRRARSQIPVVGVTGRAPGWPGALKFTRRRLYSRRINTLRQKGSAWRVFHLLNIISIHTSRFYNKIKQIWQPLLFTMHGIYFIPRFYPQNPVRAAADRPPRLRPVRPYTGIWLWALKWLLLFSELTYHDPKYFVQT